MNENSSENRFDRYESRQQRREERRALRGSTGWVGGFVLIILGLIMLGQNMKILTFTNWWALFILLPAFGSLGTAWGLYQSSGRFSVRARGAAIFGLFLTAVTAMILFNLNWTLLGPGLLILAGIGLFVNALLPE